LKQAIKLPLAEAMITLTETQFTMPNFRVFAHEVVLAQNGQSTAKYTVRIREENICGQLGWREGGGRHQSSFTKVFHKISGIHLPIMKMDVKKLKDGNDNSANFDPYPFAGLGAGGTYLQHAKEAQFKNELRIFILHL
jgi:hypothetical protein